MIFLTVGTQFGFDRLVRAVDDWLATRPGIEVFGQIGSAGYWPAHFNAVKWLDRHEYLRRFRESEGVVSHAGMGTIMQCLDESKPLVVFPRQMSPGECINEHQVTMARMLERLGLIQVAYDELALPGKLDHLHEALPTPRATGSGTALVAHITDYLASVQPKRRRGS